MSQQKENVCPQENENEFEYTDTLDGFLDFITQDTHGRFGTVYHNFENCLRNAYYDMQPENFFNIYKNFINLFDGCCQCDRAFLEGSDEKILYNIKQVYNEAKEVEQNPDDTREPYFVFGLILWLLIWH